MVEQMFNGGATAKGALIITPEKIIVTTPGADNKKSCDPITRHKLLPGFCLVLFSTHKFDSSFHIAL